MRKLLSLKLGWAFTIFSLLDIIATGMGMGVPFFNILLGFPLGGLSPAGYPSLKCPPSV